MAEVKSVSFTVPPRILPISVVCVGGTFHTLASYLSTQTVPLDEVVLAQAFQLEALMNVLEWQGLIRKAEVLEEIKRLKAGTPTGR